MLENTIVAIAGEKRPSNTFERFDPEVTLLVRPLLRPGCTERLLQVGEWTRGDYKLRTMRVQADATVVPKSFYSC